MDGQRAPRPGAGWLRWFPGPDPVRRGWYCLLRFESVDDAGMPLGKPFVSETPAGLPRRWPTEARAQAAADWQNAEENR